MERTTSVYKRVTAVVIAILGWCVLATADAQAQAQQNNRVLISPKPTTLLSAGGCTVGLLNLRIMTGNDDLRGGNNNLDVEVHFANGDMQTATNVNKSGNWPNHSVNVVGIHLNHPVAPNQIRQLRLVHSAQAGYTTSAGKIGETAIPVAGPMLATINTAQGIQTEDNWDMAQFQAFGLGKGTNVPIASFGFHRFTGSNPSLDINAQPEGCPTGNQITKLSFTFWTSDDDLRGGNDNLNVVDFSRTIGVSPDDYEPAIVKLTPAQNTCRIVGATQGKEDVRSTPAADWQMYSHFLEERVVATPQKIGPGKYKIAANSELVPGEYGVVLRPVSKNKRFSGGDVARAQGDGLMFDAIWTFQVSEAAE